MALNGINLALAWSGQEAIWQRVRAPHTGHSRCPCPSPTSAQSLAQRIRAPECLWWSQGPHPSRNGLPGLRQTLGVLTESWTPALHHTRLRSPVRLLLLQSLSLAVFDLPYSLHP